MFDVAVWGTVAEWFVAVGTIGVVITSLWLIRRGERERLEIFVTRVSRGPNEEMNIAIENIGNRPVRVTSLFLVLRKRGRKTEQLSYPFVGIPARVEAGADVERPWPCDNLLDFLEPITDLVEKRISIEVRTARGARIKAPCPDLKNLRAAIYDPLTGRFIERPPRVHP